jgi:hypothetical protein
VSRDLHLQLSEENADAERLAVLAGYLRADLLRLDVDDVRVVSAGAPPPGARGIGVAAVDALLIALSQSAQELRSVVSSVRDWLRRADEPSRTVRLELDGDVLELSQASMADQDRLVELFISRHTAGNGPR